MFFFFYLTGESRGERLSLLMEFWATTEFDVIVLAGCTPVPRWFFSLVSVLNWTFK